ncbi:hypothetical protein LZL79_32570 [Pseudomonas aeruginosa]|nr:hypothetical protein [Pseudomonas aeruginosa]
MHTSNPRHETRDAVLIAIAEDMIARTSMSQDGFAERLNIELNLRAPERCRAKDYPGPEGPGRRGHQPRGLRPDLQELEQAGGALARRRRRDPGLD